MSAKRLKENLPGGFELCEIDISGELKKRRRSMTLLITAKTAKLFNLVDGDQVIAKVIAIKKVGKE